MAARKELRTVSMEEVQKHNAEDDCWLVLCGKVYDLTDFHKAHPGGSKIITSAAGMDASAPFQQVHPADIAERLLSPDVVIGKIDKSTIKPEHVVAAPKNDDDEDENQEPIELDVSQMLNAFDFEQVAKLKMNKEGWAYYSSGSDDEITLRENHNAFQRIWLRPRVLVDVAKIDLSSQILGFDTSIPLYISATALGRLAHPDGEQALCRAAHASGIIQMIPTLSSCSVDEMLDARADGQIVFSQLYVNQNRQRTLEYIQRIEAEGVRALFITVDAPQLGRREKDMRNKFSKQGTSIQKADETEGKVNRDQGVTRAISSFIDPSLKWEDLQWFFENTKLPIILKGVQCAEDAVLALRYGCAGIVLSNHGGRQLDLARSGIEVLPEVMAALRKEPGYSKQHFEVYVDGGIRRGADIFKALALGATAVGIGRPSIYSLAAFGPEGVERMIEIFKDELEMCMRLMGTPSVAHICEEHVITRNLADHFATQPRDNLLLDTYEPIRTAAADKTKSKL
ncbi:Peroxisomal S-2-hydroxy-acid oxidase [Hondaea fermentalgiana]|uniref:L-lactate dehydrogenase (cytochrome) n=1 Tax=Hondaea fermentalgiana TaxID=2315210 RepID=A0A2R5GJE1_9STRA|nr:Peroxisomal S-2-hydroxy-acid oxidase [Hondaea fermentalgiana]|eukprot:GBG30735.1 Peroxisomal S-2-hydroxy-acid oxidase [Hondaea fermentalgiana]